MIAANNVDLTAGPATKVPVENLIPIPLQETTGQVLATRPAFEMRGLGARQPAAPTAGDGGDGSMEDRVHQAEKRETGLTDFTGLGRGELCRTSGIEFIL